MACTCKVSDMCFSVQHVLMKPEVKGLDGEVAGPPPQEPTYVILVLTIFIAESCSRY